MQAAVAELKAHLSAFLKRVKAGQEILVTERGLPVARLVPISADARRKGRRQDLADKGLLRLGRGRVRKSLLVLPGPEDTVPGVVEALLSEREEGR